MKMKYEDLKQFMKRTRRSKSKIYRFYNANQELFAETKMNGIKRVYPIEHIRYFDSEVMFDENKMLRQENSSMKNLIDCLVDKDSLQYKLWTMDWDYFFTVAYRAERSKTSCFKQMHGLFEFLTQKHGIDVGIRIFFTTEPFANRAGYHNHFVIHIDDKRLHDDVISDIKSYFSFDRLDCGVYDRYKAGLFYISKTGLINEDWDIIYNKLNDEQENG